MKEKQTIDELVNEFENHLRMLRRSRVSFYQYRQTWKPLPFAKRYFKNEISELIQIKAVFITSANFYEDGQQFLAKLNSSKLKPSNLNTGYNGKQLIQLFATKDFQKEIKIIEKYCCTQRKSQLFRIGCNLYLLQLAILT